MENVSFHNYLQIFVVISKFGFLMAKQEPIGIERSKFSGNIVNVSIILSAKKWTIVTIFAQSGGTDALPL